MSLPLALALQQPRTYELKTTSQMRMNEKAEQNTYRRDQAFIGELDHGLADWRSRYPKTMNQLLLAEAGAWRQPTAHDVAVQHGMDLLCDGIAPHQDRAGLAGRGAVRTAVLAVAIARRASLQAFLPPWY